MEDKPKADTSLPGSPTTVSSPNASKSLSRKDAAAASGMCEGSTIVTEELLRLAEETQTIVPQGTWVSLGSEEEIHRENNVGVQKRPPIAIRYNVARQVVVRHHSVHAGFMTKEASEDSRDLRSTQNPLYETFRLEVEHGVQAVRTRRDVSTQTHFARQVNAAVQAEPTLVDACVRHIEVPKKESPELSQFLKRVLPRTLHCLTQNYEVPIYSDEFNMFKEDDALMGARDDMLLIERGNYTHNCLKDRRVSSVDWRSARAKDDLVCVASVSTADLEARIEASRHCDTSLSLVWAFSDPMHPRYILESPNEVQVLKFSPSRPGLVVGGAMNGQVYLWDLTEVERMSWAAERDAGGGGGGGDDSSGGGGAGNMRGHKDAGDVPAMPEGIKGVSLVRDGDVSVPKVQPTQVSRVELSHRRPVHDLQWLPRNIECTFDGRQVVVESSHQFATLSDDGSVMIWDIRPEFLPQDKLRKMKHTSKTAGSDVTWVPLHRYQLTPPDGSIDLMGFRLFFDGPDGEGIPKYSLGVGTTAGEFAYCSLVAASEQNPSQLVPIFGNTKDTRCVQSVVRAHAGPVYAVQRHPLIGDVYLTCGDYTFRVWRDQMPLALYASPVLDSPITCAAWSPARAAVVFIGTGDGKVQVWDLLDRNSGPMLVHHLVQDAITSIAFKPLPTHLNQKFSQQLAIGTKVGSFHWYALPHVLSKPPSGERRHFRAMLEREVRRAVYYKWRWDERQLEIDRYGSSAPKMLSVATVGAGGGGKRDGEDGGADQPQSAAVGKKAGKDDDADNFYALDEARDAEFLELVEKLHKAEEEQMRIEAVS